ncbi:MAG: alpha-L-rhamnosidase N-terminal domain-containing protein [Prevotella sp.]
MKRLILVCFSVMFVCVFRGQGFDTHWITAPVSDSTSHVWFRQTYLPQGRPQQAYIMVATTGVYKLYVNECNVGTAVFYPSRQAGSDDIVSMTFDVTTYLRPDTNVIALVYSPSYPNVKRRQVAVSFYGLQADGSSFCYNSDENWLCRQANSRIKPDGGEVVDGRYHNPSWNAAWFDQALWVNAEEVKVMPTEPATISTGTDLLLRVIHRREPFYAEQVGDSVEYEFGIGFYGYARLTLRKTKQGERISIGNLDYICSGDLDEQAYPVFSLDNYRRVSVSGDKRFRRDQIFGIESVEIAPVKQTFLYE